MNHFGEIRNDFCHMETVLVTGGTGLVGHGIQAAIERSKFSINTNWVFLGSVDGDLRDKNAVRAIFEKHNPTRVVHLAARVGGLFANIKHKVEFFRDNIAINANVLDACREFKVVKVVSCLSTCIFPDATTYPVHEGMIHDGPPHSSNEGYAYAKRMIDVMNRAYAEEYGCNFTSIVPTNIFGPHDNFSIEAGHVLPGLMHKCLLAKKSNTPLVVWGSGEPLRQFIYSLDLGKLIVWALYNYDSIDPLILSPEEETSIGEVAHLIAETMIFSGNVEFDRSKSDGQHKKTACNAKLRGLHPEFEFTNLKIAIQETCEWFQEHYDTCRL